MEGTFTSSVLLLRTRVRKQAGDMKRCPTPWADPAQAWSWPYKAWLSCEEMRAPGLGVACSGLATAIRDIIHFMEDWSDEHLGPLAM